VLLIRQAYYPGNLRFKDQAEKLADEGNQVVVLSLRRPGEPRKEIHGGITIYRVPFSWIRHGLVLFALQYALFLLIAFGFATIECLRRRVDAVLVSNLPDILVFCAVIPKIMGKRLILDIRDPLPELLATRYGLKSTSPLCKIAVLEEKIGCWFADGVLTVHEPIRRLLENRGVPPEKLWVLYNFPDSKEFYLRSTSRPGSASGTGPQLIFHGTIAHRFGIDTAIEAVRDLRKTCPGVHLSIYGEGEALSYLKQLARDEGVDDCVAFHGFQPASIIAQALSKADIAVIPHRRTPGMDIVLPTKLLESMACGLPAVVSKSPVMEELLPENTVRYFVAGDAAGLTEAILGLSKHPDVARKVASSALTWLSEFRECRYQREFADWVLFGDPARA
jgi:glycosyltransferase involved in cell wall biosynthesis